MNRKSTLSLLGVVAVLSMWVTSCASDEPSDAQAHSVAVSKAALASYEVSAGPDMSGWANEPLTLQGAVSGDGGEPTLSWSVVPAEGTDPTATCTFGAPDAASTPFTCTQGGSYTVKLTASDETGAASSDTATVTLRNAFKVTLCNLPAATRPTTLKLCGFISYTTDDTSGFDSVWFTVNGGDAMYVPPGGQVSKEGVPFTQEGPHVVRLSVKSKAGHVSIQERTVTVDSTGPTLQVLSPLDGEEVMNPRSVPVTSWVSDTLSPVTVVTQLMHTSKVEGGEGTVTHTLDLGKVVNGQVVITDGLNKVKVTATDKLGNATEVSLYVYIREPGCGNGKKDGTERCDDGNILTEVACPYGQASCTACDSTCYKVLTLTGPACGDGERNGPEACDDGNTVTENACPYGEANCTRCDATCSTVLSLTGPVCGDGETNGPEVCDDGNTVTEDSCPSGQVSCTSCDSGCSAVLNLSGLCTQDAQCGPGRFCNSGGVCVTQLPDGAECGAANQCGSGSCVDGVCCNTACGGACDSCNQAGKVGTCSPAAAGSTGSPTCAPYVCNGTTASCPATCTSDAQCSSGNSCNANGACVVKLVTCVIEGVSYEQGTSNPSNPCQVCDLSQSTTAWSNKPVNTSCRDTAYGNWSTCSGFSGPCEDTGGSQSRTVTTYACTSTGTCAATSSSQTQECSRYTEGTDCRYADDCSECSGFDGTCGQKGTQSCSQTTYTCSGGSCNPSSTSETWTQSCWRDTNGAACGSEVDCTECSGFNDTCDESGTQLCTGTDYKCSGGTCNPLPSETWVRECSVDKSNNACKEVLTPVGECNSEGQQFCRAEYQYCQSGGCSGGWWTTFVYKPCGECK